MAITEGTFALQFLAVVDGFQVPQDLDRNLFLDGFPFRRTQVEEGLRKFLLYFPFFLVQLVLFEVDEICFVQNLLESILWSLPGFHENYSFVC